MSPNKFQKIRAAHDRETAEDYVEMIQQLIDDRRSARLTELAKRFAVSAVTAHKIVARLKKEQLVDSQPYGELFLTAKGQRLATESRVRHRLVLDFLCALGITKQVAEIDAEGIEHHVSRQTLEAFRRFLDK